MSEDRRRLAIGGRGARRAVRGRQPIRRSGSGTAAATPGPSLPTPTNPRTGGAAGGHNKPTIARDPLVPERLRRFTELLSNIVNSLVGGGYLKQTSPDTWIIANPPWVETRAPFLTDDEDAGVQAGNFWYDSTTGFLYYAVTATPGNALWVKVN